MVRFLTYPAVIVVSMWASLAALAADTPSRQMQLQHYEESLQRDGGRATLKTFDSANGYALVKTGDPRAIALAAKLYAFSDAGSTESLNDSFARALAKNPEAVLSHIPDIQQAELEKVKGRVPEADTRRQVAEGLCVPFISDELPLRPELTNLRRTENALLRVRRADLQGAKQTCLTEIRKSEASLQQSLRNGHK